MKKLLFLFSIFAAPLFSRAQSNDPTTLTKVGDKSPTFYFWLTKDKKANLEDYRGKIVVIDFFATWCPPCRQELPRIQKEIWEKYKNNPKFALLAFDREEGWDKILPLKQQNQFTFLMSPDLDRSIFKLYATQSIPRLLVLDEKGTIIYQSIGYLPSEFDNMLALLATKLK